MMTGTVPTGRRRFVRFSLRALFVVLTIACVSLGIWADRAAKQRRAVEMIRRVGGRTIYRDQVLSEDPFPAFVPDMPSIEMPWYKLFGGEDYWRSLNYVLFNVTERHDDDPPAPRMASADIALLADVRSIEHLGLWEVALTDEDLARLRSLTNLRTLQFDSTKLTDEGLQHLGNFKRLGGLTLSGDPHSSPRIADGALVHLKNLRGLRDLRIDCPTRLSGESMLQLCDLKNLEVVSLSFAPNTISDMKWLKQWPKLKSVGLTNAQIDQEGWATLCSMSALSTLTLLNSTVDDKQVEQLTALPKLEMLWLEESQVSGTGVGSLSALVHLSLTGPAASDLGMEAIGRLANLDTLDLRGSGVTDAGLRHLRSLQGLRMLLLSHTQIGDICLAELAALPALRHLELQNTNVTDVGLVHLQKLPLDCLKVRGTQVTKAGVERLKAATGRWITTDLDW